MPRPDRPTLRRSVALYRSFRQEQTDPDGFYSALAADAVDQLGRYTELRDRRVLDVGAGPGYFATAFGKAGACYVPVDVDGPHPGHARAAAWVRADAAALPLRTASVDVCFSSNLIEHVAAPWRVADEQVRVVRPGGIVAISFTPWLSPWGGHETSPWHYLGGTYARERYERRTGRPPKNRWQESLFGHSVGDALRWARSRPDVELVDALPRYHPWWLTWVSDVPGLREVASWNLLMVLRRREHSRR